MTDLTSSDTRPDAWDSQRLFTDEFGRVWRASFEDLENPVDALVFRCVSDERQALRGIAVDASELGSALDDALRVWLHHAPRIGNLS